MSAQSLLVLFLCFLVSKIGSNQQLTRAMGVNGISATEDDS